jgi:hypothetical protein
LSSLNKINAMQKILSLLIVVFFCLDAALCQTVTPISGWTVDKENNSKILSSQSINEDGKLVVYQVRKQATTEHTTTDWFTAAIKADIEKEQWTEPGKGMSNEANNIQLYITEVTDAASKKWFILYMGYGFGKKQVRLARVVSSPEGSFFQTNGGIATKHFARLSVQDGKSNTTIATTEVQEPVKEKQPVKTKDPLVNVKGTPAVSFHAVIMHLEYEAGMGGAIYPVYNAYILFKNGSIYKHPVISPADLDVASSKQTEPQKWGTWKIDADKLNVYWPLEKPKYQNNTWEKSSYKNVLPAKKGETLEGSFKTLTGGGNTALGGDVLVVAAANISFNQQGKFTLAKTAGVSSGSDVWENTNSKTGETGTYTMDGYTIELKYNNGKTQRQFFYFYPDSRKHFGIANSAYMPKSK